MGGDDIPGMMIVMPDDHDDGKRSYGSDTILTVRAKNPKLACGKENK